MSVYKRGDVWWVKFQCQGQIVRRSARTGLKRVAEQYERDLRNELTRQGRGGRPRYTFNDMMARFVGEHFRNLKPGSQRRYATSIKALKPHFDGADLDGIGRRQVSDFVSVRRRLVTTTSVRRDLACLSSAFELAICWDWADSNPVKAVSKRSIPEAEPRRRYLSHDEYERLIAQAADYLRPAIIFAVATGMRLEEQLSLTWGQCNLQRREATLERAKSGHRIVPLNETAVRVLRERNHIRFLGSQWVFCKPDGSRYGKFTRGLAGAAKRANINDLRWHDLRRTCGSWMLQSGVDIKTVSIFLGHKSVVVTERSYAFLQMENLHAAVGNRAQKLARGAGIEGER